MPSPTVYGVLRDAQVSPQPDPVPDLEAGEGNEAHASSSTGQAGLAADDAPRPPGDPLQAFQEPGQHQFQVQALPDGRIIIRTAGANGQPIQIRQGQAPPQREPPWPFRQLRNCPVQPTVIGWLFIFIIGAIFSIICFFLCLPCICCWARSQARWVVLDGRKPPKQNAEAKDRIDSAKSGTFRANLEDLAPAVSRNLSKALGHSGSNLFSAPSEKLAANQGIVAHDAAAKRELLKTARIEACDQSKTPIPPGLKLRVEREQLLQQSLNLVGSAKATDLMGKKLSVSFLGESGLDAGGVGRDWFDSIGRALVEAAEKGDGHLQVLPDKTLRPRPYEDRFSDLFAIGRLIGLSLWFGYALPVPLGSVTCKFMLDVPISPLDVQRLDPDFVQFRVKPVLRPGGVADLEAALCEPLTFMSAATEIRASKELCPGGAEKRVTEENKLEYLQLLCEHHLCGDMQEQIKVFLEGFWNIFPQDVLICSGLSHRELALLICGFGDLDPEDWRRNTMVSTTDADELLTWFWAMVGDMSPEERAKLLHFTTGSTRLPAAGFAGMTPNFNISVGGDEEHLPQAHTCGNQLVLPRYATKEQLVEKMRVALANDEGFGFA